MGTGPPEVSIHASSIAVGTLAGNPVALNLAELAGSFRLWRKYTWSTDLRVQQAAGRQGLVADRLSFQTNPLLAPEPTILWIDSRQVLSIARVLAISGRRDDQLVQFLLAPAALHEFTRQPIQQFRMSWRRALGAEIIVGCNQSFAEIVLPHPVHGHPGCQRIALVNEPTGQIQPVRSSCRFERWQDSRHARRDSDSLAQEVASNLHKGFAGLRQFTHHQGAGHLGFLSAEGVDTALPLPETKVRFF